MRNQLTALWTDESGMIISAELVMIGTVGVLALMSGLVCVRDSINGELHELSEAFGSVNQSYYYSGQHGCLKDGNMVSSYTAGSSYTDVCDQCDLQSDLCCKPTDATQKEHHHIPKHDHHPKHKHHDKPASGSISTPQQSEADPIPVPEVPDAPSEEPMELKL